MTFALQARWHYPGVLSLLLLAAIVPAFAQVEDPLSAVPTRPNFTNAADTVGPGVLQVEYGTTIQRFEGDSNGAALTGTYTVGILRNLDLRWNADHVLTSATRGIRKSGLGDTWLGVRYRAREQSRNLPSIGVLYQIKAPTSNPHKNLGSGCVDHSVAMLLSKDVGAVRLDANLVQYGVGTHKGLRGSTLGSLAISRALRGRLGGLLEGYGGRAVDGSGVASALAALTWKWKQQLASDVGMEFGMTKGVPRNRFVVGVSYALVRLWRPTR